MADNNIALVDELKADPGVRIKAINVVDESGNVAYTNIPLVSDYEYVQVTNPNLDNKNTYTRTLKDALVAKYVEEEVELAEGEDSIKVRQKIGYHDYDFDTHSIVDDLVNYQADLFERFFALPDKQIDGVITKQSFANASEAKAWFLDQKWDEVYTDDQLNKLAEVYSQSSLYAAGMQQMTDFTKQIYGIYAQNITINEVSYSTANSEHRNALKGLVGSEVQTISLTLQNNNPVYLGSFAIAEHIKEYWPIIKKTLERKADGSYETKVSFTGFANDAEATVLQQRVLGHSFMQSIFDIDNYWEDLAFGGWDSTSEVAAGAIITKGQIDALFNE